MTAPSELLSEAFPIPPVARTEVAPALAAGLAAAGALAMPVLEGEPDAAFERRVAAIALQLSDGLGEAVR